MGKSKNYRLVILRFFFFRFDLGFSANRRHLRSAKPRSRPCASRNDFTYSSRGAQLINPLLYRRRSSYCRLARIWPPKFERSSKSKNRPIFEQGTAWDCFWPSCTVGKTRATPLEKVFFSVGYLSETGLVPRSAWLADFLCLSVNPNMNEKKRSQNRTEQNLIRIRI